MEWAEEGGVGPTGQEGKPSIYVYFSQLLKRSQGWNPFVILCTVFLKSFLELDGSRGGKQQMPTRLGKISGSVLWSLQEERLGIGCRKQFSKFLAV